MALQGMWQSDSFLLTALLLLAQICELGQEEGDLCQCDACKQLSHVLCQTGQTFKNDKWRCDQCSGDETLRMYAPPWPALLRPSMHVHVLHFAMAFRSPQVRRCRGRQPGV